MRKPRRTLRRRRVPSSRRRRRRRRVNPREKDRHDDDRLWRSRYDGRL